MLDVKISHRFGYLNGGIYDLFGLDESSVRLGADYGVSDRLTIGVGRSSYEKTYDGFIKYKLLRQSTGLKNMPVTMAIPVSYTHLDVYKRQILIFLLVNIHLSLRARTMKISQMRNH